MAEDKQFPWQMSEVRYRKVTMEYDAGIRILIRETEKGLFDSGRGGIVLPMEMVSIGANQQKIYCSIGETNDGKSFFYDSILGLSLSSSGQ